MASSPTTLTSSSSALHRMTRVGLLPFLLLRSSLSPCSSLLLISQNLSISLL